MSDETLYVVRIPIMVTAANIDQAQRFALDDLRDPNMEWDTYETVTLEEEPMLSAAIKRHQCASELVVEGWPNVAEDVREGVSTESLLRRLREIGEGDSVAADIIAMAEM